MSTEEILWKIATVVFPTLILLGIIALFYKWIKKREEAKPSSKSP